MARSIDLIAEATGVGVWTTDDPRPPDELLRAAIHPEDLAEVQRRTAQIIERESEYSFDFRIVRPDGAVRWLAARGSVMRDEQGRALRLLGINWDITEHKRGEDMRREKAAAEEASHAKSEFLSRMSHELRTPLNAVLGFAQLMLQDPVQSLAPRQRERTEHIRDAGRHLLALIDDVLDLTSVEVGTVPLEAQPVVIAPLSARRCSGWRRRRSARRSCCRRGRCRAWCSATPGACARYWRTCSPTRSSTTGREAASMCR